MTQADKSPADTFVRFMAFVEMGKEEGACWTWTGNRIRNGYGHFAVGLKTVKAHRWIYELVCEPIPAGLLIRHRCDNPSCVNPRHLEPGTHKDNAQDKVQRGRSADRKGEKHPLARLTADKVREIRRLSAMGRTQKSLSDEYGVRHGQIGKIVRRQNWSHI